jgi:RNA polymerase sigma-70 factor, ECF subfamily
MPGARLAATEQESNLDAELEAVARGDVAAFRRLYDASVSLLSSVAFRLMRDREAAQDVLQESMIRIWRRAHLFDRSKGNALGWMIVVTRNCALSRLAIAAPPLVSLDDEAVHSVVGAKVADDPALAADVRRCLKLLSDKFCKCVTLVYFYGLTYEELAHQMKAPLGTVKTWVHRAIGELAVCMEK